MDKKIFAVAFRYGGPSHFLTSHKLGVVYIEAESEKQAKERFGYSDVIGIREITLDQLLLTGNTVQG